MTRFNVLLLLALIASAIYLVRVSYDARRLFAEVDRAEARERQLDIEFERLKADKQAQATPSRVEKAARERLGMRAATPAVTNYVTHARRTPAGAPEAAR
jgi:cell division protein FtsL